MSDLFKKDPNELEPTPAADKVDIVDEKTSTVFSAPVEHKVKAPKNATKKRLLSIIASFLVVAMLIGGTFAIIKYIPVMIEDETVPAPNFESFDVVKEDTKSFDSVTVTNQNGEFKFVTKEINATDASGKTQTTTYWTVDGVDVSKLSSTTIDGIIKAAANIVATNKIDKKTPAECGLDKPKYKIAVTQKDKDPYTILIGNESTDGMGGVYMMFEGKNEIYVVQDSGFDATLDFKLMDLTDVAPIPITTFPSNTTDNKIADGTYAFFDSLTISGKLFPEMITIVNNKAETDSASLLPYLITTPTPRYANSENLNSLVALFSTTCAVAGNYALDTSEETLKKYSLDNPDVVVTMTIDGTARTFKFTLMDDQHCAVVYDGATMVRKVLTGNHAFLSLKPEDLYLKNLFMNSINDVKTLKFKDADGNIKFDISYTEDAEQQKTYNILANNKKIVAEYFQSFYANFVGLQCFNFAVDDIDAKPDGTVTIVFNDNSETVIDFYRANATEYQYAIDGSHIGKITSTAYQKMVNNLKKVAAGEEPV